jgi:acylphosphatase
VPAAAQAGALVSDPVPGDDLSAAEEATWSLLAQGSADLLADPDFLAGMDCQAGPDAGAEQGDPAGSDSQAADDQARLTAWVQGRVQGVGFRWWVRGNALELGLAGMAENLTDGRVKVVVEGAREICAALLKRLEGTDTPGKVVQVTFRWDRPRGGLSGFAER